MKPRFALPGAFVLLGAMLAACASDSLRDSENSPVAPLPTDRCATPNDGCTCQTPGQSTECGVVKEKVGDYTLCTYGTRTCEADKTWGTCLLSSNAKQAYVGYGLGLSLNGLGVPASCGNLCDPNCVATTDTPIGLDAGPGTTIGPSGLVLSSDASVVSTCTGVKIETAQGATLDNDINLPVPRWNPASMATIHLNSMVMPSISGGVSALAPLPTIGGTLYKDSTALTNSYVPLKAVLTPVGCDADGNNGVPFNSVIWSTSRQSQASVGSVGTVAGERVAGLYFFATVAGPLDVTVQAGSFSATLQLHVQADLDMDIGTLKPTLSGVEVPANPAATWLYPLANTVFPLGLEPPVLMWNKPAAGTESGTANFRTSLVHKDLSGKEDFRWSIYGQERSNRPRATSEWLDGRADYARQLYDRNLLARPGVGLAGWTAFERTAAVLASSGSPGSATIELARKVGGVLARSPDLNVSFVNEALRGKVYFTNYGSRRDTSQTDKWLKIWPSERMYDTKLRTTNNDVYQDKRNFCPTCHSVSGNGKVFLSAARGANTTLPPGIAYLDNEGRARTPWSVTELTPDSTCWSTPMLDGTETSAKLCRLNNSNGKRVESGATMDELRNSDATRVDWFDSDPGLALYGEAAPGHTWDFGNDRIRHQGQWSQIWLYTFNFFEWATGTHYHSRYPHGRSDSPSGPAWAALTFDGRYYLQGNAIWGNTWGSSQAPGHKDHYDGTPFRLIEVGRPVIQPGNTAATAARWSTFRDTWDGMARCNDPVTGNKRFWCDVTADSRTGVPGLERVPLILPSFSPPTDTREGAPSTGEKLAAVLGGPTASYGLGAGASAGSQALVMGEVTRAATTVQEKVEGATALAARSAQGLSVGALKVVGTISGTERYQSVSAGPGGEQVVAQVGTSRMPGGMNACYNGSGDKVAEYMECKLTAETNFDNNTDHGGTQSRYRDMKPGSRGLPHCYDTSGGNMPRFSPCENASHTFHDRDTNPAVGTYSRAAASTYMVSVCRGALNAGLVMSDASSAIPGSAIGATTWYAYVTGDSSTCTAALNGSGHLNVGHSSKPRRSVCESDDSFLGLQPYNVSGVTKYQYVCQRKDRYAVIRCASGASPTYATVNNAAGVADCVSPRATPYENVGDTYIGVGELADPMSYCIDGGGGKYRVHGCDNGSASGKWVSSVCDRAGTTIADESLDCKGRGGKYIEARGGIAGSGFGWVDSYLQKSAPSGVTWQSVPLANASPSSPASTVAERKDYFPSLYAERVGGFSWLLFSSARPFGNAYSNDANSPIAGLGANNEAALCGGTDVTKHYAQTLLWASALDAPTAANASVDTSHAPFLLPGQQFGLVCSNDAPGVNCDAFPNDPDCLKRQVGLSERPVWVKAACSPTVTGGGGSTTNQCEDDKECCDIGAKCTLDLPAVPSDPYSGLQHCRVPASACLPLEDRTGDACSTNADCCGLTCAGYVCQAAPCAPQYTASASYDRVYTSTCGTGKRVEWDFVEWTGDAPNNSRVSFYVSAGVSEAAAAGAPAPGTLVGSATGVSSVTAQKFGMTSLSAADRSKAWLRLRMVLDPSTLPDKCSSPAIRAWRVGYTCKDDQ